MTLTVRLPETLEQALDKYSSSQGLTKSQVVQEALAEYLKRDKRQGKYVPEGQVSENYRALKKAGLIGCVHGDGVSATKEVVRKKILESFKAKADAQRR